MTILKLTAAILIILKALNYIELPWHIITLPFWIELAASLFILGSISLVKFIADVFDFIYTLPFNKK